MAAEGRWLLNTVQIYKSMNFGQLSSGCLIQVGCLIEVTTNTGLTVASLVKRPCYLLKLSSRNENMGVSRAENGKI